MAMMHAAQQEGCQFRYILVYDVKRFGRLDTDEAGITAICSSYTASASSTSVMDLPEQTRMNSCSPSNSG